MIKGGLFTRYFLEDGIKETIAYKNLTEASLHHFTQTARAHWQKLRCMALVNEAETISELINPILESLGWFHLPQQKTGKDGKDVPDALLFLSSAIKNQALPLPSMERFKLGTLVVEHEARDTRLDRASATQENPAGQILRYLSRADIASNGALRWGLLTSGRYWRLYDHRALSRVEGFIEFSLPDLLEDNLLANENHHWLRVFMLLFQAVSFVPEALSKTTFVEFVLAEGKKYEQRITASLSGIVFSEVFPSLITAIGAQATQAQITDSNWRETAREFGLKLLFRLLFLLYAEDRDLLPVNHPGYQPYALRTLRNEAAEIANNNKALSPKAKIWWSKLSTLFKAIATGDDDMGLPPYNGGLFDDTGNAGIELPDAVLVSLIEKMSREGPVGNRRWINYRDLSVQQLGSIYEQLLEQDVVDTTAPSVNASASPVIASASPVIASASPVIASAAKQSILTLPGLALRPNAFARKTTGSYYTPDELVQLILRRAIFPLLKERSKNFKAKSEELAHDKRPISERLKILAKHDAASAFITLRIIDPAMGSGHFLVSLVDFLADHVLAALADAPTLVPWADADTPYRSLLAIKISQLRSTLQTRAQNAGWPVRDDQLDDRHLVRRIILKRVIYGVDMNPMAVELAKLSLWLHSFTVGAPLSFLDHHLRVGDSLFGEFVAPVQQKLRDDYGFVMTDAVTQAANSAAGMAMVEALSDADITEVKESAIGFAGVEEATVDLRAFLNFYQAARWLPGETLAQQSAIATFFGGGYGDPVAIAAGAKPKIAKDGFGAKKGKQIASAKEIHDAAIKFFANAKTLIAERKFLHWEAAFPGVWQNWETAEPTGGFDAVIGNPPWDRMKLQEVEWFAARKPEIAFMQRASDRKKAIAGLRKIKDSLADDFAKAEAAAEGAARVARNSGAYPLLSSGDINIYSLFVERAERLAHKEGIVGLLVPSGIAADLGAAPFFRSISTTGRLESLLDFENGKRKPAAFFPDVHRSFKFSALIFAGAARQFAEAKCAFFQQDAIAAEQEAFALTPVDFAAVNPNTGTAPVFRNQRDADITRAIYARLPVLVDRRGAKPVAVWPVRYVTMFHMTNDSDKFITAAELEKSGAYKVQGGRWEKGEERWLPLYEGKMVQAYDHRAASITVNPENVKRPAQPEETSPEQHANPHWLPEPQFWVNQMQLPVLQSSFPSLRDAEANLPLPSLRDVDLPLPSLRGGASRRSNPSSSNNAVPKDGLLRAARNDDMNFISFKDVTSPTNVRTIIAAIVPYAGYGNTLPIYVWKDGQQLYDEFVPQLLANLNSVIMDYIARQKIQGQHLNSYILEQLPVIPPGNYAQKFGLKTAAEIIREDVLHLTYVSHDMAGFAASQGYTGAPFAWDEEDRLRRRARLDALFFHLYGIKPDDIKYILSTFPIVIREEVQKYGKFRSQDLILGYYNALAAGNPDAAIAG